MSVYACIYAIGAMAGLMIWRLQIMPAGVTHRAGCVTGVASGARAGAGAACDARTITAWPVALRLIQPVLQIVILIIIAEGWGWRCEDGSRRATIEWGQRPRWGRRGASGDGTP